jgi:PAS domain S-box-containing protein
MSVPPQIGRSTPEARNGGSLAVSHLSLSPFGGEGDPDSGCQVLWEDGERVFRRGWRLGEDGSRSPVLVILPLAAHPSPSSLDRLTHEHGLKEELDRAWAMRPLEIVRDARRTMLVLEDVGGFEPLDRLLAAPMEVESFLRLAIGIAGAVGKVHESGLVHKDIKPFNILLNRATGEVKLTGFGIASRLPREHQAPNPPETIAGTLAYMAPEQTGRMNRSIDSRSDLYALGVTFYRMLTGVLPFSAADPSEWVHCHIAKKPTPPAERLKTVPAVLSDVVMKLMAKTAEVRYQTAAGVEHNLRRCRAQWEAERRIDPFPLGERDPPDRLMIPERLYGREREVEVLRAAFDRIVAGGGPELFLVAGQAGVGKSAVVHELHCALAPTRGLFASGKFDQYKRDIPYAGLTQALRDLIRPLLNKSEAELAPWRAALSTALSPNGALMVTLIPDLELLIGPQPPAPELPPRDAQRRFQLVLRRLLGVFARSEHPLALFLDDLQWLDAATLDLLENLLTQRDLKHLVLIGAYRNDEVMPTHPLIRRLAAIRQAGGRAQEIVLKPLRLADVNRIVADALHSGRAQPLARLLHEKTAGNPFFTIQFLTALAEEGLLVFDHDAARWTWDLKRIRAKCYTDNVADLMLGKLRGLPAATRAVLKRLACLGSSAPIATLALIQSGSEDALHATLGAAVRARLLLRQEGAYRFLHDRVREAAYALIPEGERAAAHLAIGRRLTAHAPLDAVEESVFEIVGQLNRGAALIRSGKERERLAELNLIAGRRAKSSTAYASALTYLTAGASVLPANARKRRHDLAFALELNRAECEFLTGALAEAEARLAELADRAGTPPGLATLTCLRVDLFMTLGRTDRAVAVGLECLRRFGIAWSARPTKDEVRDEYGRLWLWLGDRSIEALIDLPPMADPVARATIDVLTSLVTPALFTDENLRCLVIGRMGNLSLEHGNSDASCYAYTAVGNVLGLTFGDYQAGFRFCQLGLDLADQPGMERLRARVYLAFGNLAKPSARYVRTGRPLAGHAFEIAQQAGDLTYAAISCNNLLTQLLATGAPLAEVQREAEAGLDFARRAHFDLVGDLITAQLGLIRTLRGLTPVFGCFNDDGFAEQQFERRLEDEPSLGIAAWMYWIRKLQARVLANEYADALVAAARAERLLWMSPAIFERADYHFCAALALIALCEAASDSESAQYREGLAVHHRQLQAWGEHCPENFVSRAALVGAEIARIEGRELDAERLYEEAIRSARTSGFVHNEALAYELAARFYVARGFEDFARIYMHNARNCYLRWGAAGKVRQLDQSYPRLRTEEPPLGPMGGIEARVEQLDLATVIKVSQAASSEIEFEKLIETLMRTAIEQAGAERGLLALARGAELRIAAEATTSGDKVVVRVGDQSISAVALPESVLNYVQRTQDNVILDDAAAGSPFAEDPHIRHRQPRSVLCLPLINQAKLIGVLYLENSLAPRVFAPARTPVLKLLASQAAISLENSDLYRKLAEREARIRRMIDADIIGVFVWNFDGRILEANDAFLRIVGYEREDLLSGRLSWKEMTPVERVQPHDKQWLSELRQTGTVRPYEKEYFRKDGSRVLVLIGEATFEEGGDEGVAFVLDLTQRQRAEEAVRRSEAYLAEAQRLSHTGTSVYNATGTLLYWSQENYRIWGLDPLQGLPDRETAWQRIHPDDRDRVRAQVLEALRQKREYLVEFRIVLPDGTVKQIEATGHPLLAAHGERVEIIATNVDVTERVRAEEQSEKLRELESDLAHMNRLSIMGELTASLAHEILHPIATARNNARAGMRFLDMIPPDLGEVREALSCVVRDADRAKDIVGRIREHVKKAPPRKDRFDLNEAIDEVIVMARGAIVRNKVSVRAFLTAGLIPIQGDRVQLQQVVLNLILNAVEAMSSAEGVRELSMVTEQSQTGDILVAVRDTGPGIHREHLERVFEAFYTTKTSGMGMGLAICRSIIDAHGGRLWVDGNEPRGAVFRFTLPAAE